jgi:hypothetical protein
MAFFFQSAAAGIARYRRTLFVAENSRMGGVVSTREISCAKDFLNDWNPGKDLIRDGAKGRAANDPLRFLIDWNKKLRRSLHVQSNRTASRLAESFPSRAL